MGKKRQGKQKKAAQPKAGPAAGGDRGAAGFALSPARIRAYLLEVQQEFNKVVWPDRKITMGLTGFVLLLSIVLAMYLGSVDLFLGKLVAAVLR